MNTPTSLVCRSRIGRIMKAAGSIALAALLLPNIAHAREIPAGVGWVNVKNHGAIGNGQADDTQAIKNALAAGSKLYFPNGTYRISSQIVVAATAGAARYKYWEGQSEANTILKLTDNNAAFQSGAVPMVSFYEGTTSHEQAFRNFVRDITFNVGKNNPGACGLRFTASNQGGIENVTIKAEPDPNASNRRWGARGLDLSKKETGPELFKNLTIDGFAYGVYLTDYGKSTTWDNITFRNQYTMVVRNVYSAMFMRKVTSTSPVKFYDDNGGVARLVLLDSTITGPGSGDAMTAGGHLLLRNVAASGWTTIVNRDSGTDITNPSTVAGEYSSTSAVSAFSPAQSKNLNLPIQETPAPPAIASANWVVVPSVSGDATTTIRNAIKSANDNNKIGICFAGGTYLVSGTIEIKGGIRHIIGYESVINASSTMQNSGAPVFKFTGLTGTDVTFERFYSNTNSTSNNFIWFEHDTDKDVVLRHIKFEKLASTTPGVYYRTGSNGTGQLFVEDVVASGWNFTNQTVYARQINPETLTGSSATHKHIVNDGGRLWIQGMKIEGASTLIETKNGGRTELLGAAISAVTPVPTDRPAFIVNESSFSGNFIDGGSGSERFARVVTEIRDGVTKHYASSSPWFYTGYTGGLTISLNGVDANLGSPAAYGGTTQDGANGKSTKISATGTEATISGNVWKMFNLTNKTVTADTMLEFTVNASDAGELLGIALDDNSDPTTGKRAFLIGGSDLSSSGWNWVLTPSYSAASGDVTYVVPVGAYFTGTVNYLGFIGDDDVTGRTYASFKNIKIYEGGQSSLTMSQASVSAYDAASQDGSGGLSSSGTVSGDGKSITITGNAWKKHAFTYGGNPITANTVMEVTVNASDAGEILGIALENDNLATNTPKRSFRFGGSDVNNTSHDAWSWKLTPAYTAGSGAATYVIPVGGFFTGSVSSLAFIGDDDANGSTNAVFSNILIYEEP